MSKLNIEQMTYNVQSALEQAQQMAKYDKLQAIETEHVLLYFINTVDSMLNTVFERADLNIKSYKSILQSALEKCRA